MTTDVIVAVNTPSNCLAIREFTTANFSQLFDLNAQLIETLMLVLVF